MTDSNSTIHYQHQFARLCRVASIILIAFFGGGLAWATTASIEGAVVAAGRVVPEGNAKEIKHSEGGYVSEILVADGDFVDEGQVLLRLDAEQVEIEHRILSEQLDQLVAIEARLIAEQADETLVTVPADLLDLVDRGPAFESLLTGQEAVLMARQSSIDSQIQQFRQQTEQLQQQIAGLQAQSRATHEELALIEVELETTTHLRDEGLITEGRVTALRRERARLVGNQGVIIADIARANLTISELELRILNITDEARRTSLEALQQVQLDRARVAQQKTAAANRLSRLDIRTARAGIVHDLRVFTLDGLVQPGERLMSIVPKQGDLIIEAKVATTDIDQLFVGQLASLTFTGFNMRTTPVLQGRVDFVSPDVELDQTTGLFHYVAHVSIDGNQTERLGDHELLPGMPVEVFVRTKARSFGSYILQPLGDHLRRAFREE
ncbi:MAG: HlyD family type I secretion periplasmic adaptor subunit [Pseudomonadota bacterium]